MAGTGLLDGATLGDILGAVLAGQPAYVCDDWQYFAAVDLSSQLASLFDVTEAQVFDALTLIPDNMLDLLNTPDGWSALASFIAAEFGIACNGYAPTVH